MEIIIKESVQQDVNKSKVAMNAIREAQASKDTDGITSFGIKFIKKLNTLILL